MRKANGVLIHDIAIIIFSILIAVILVKSGILGKLLTVTVGIQYIESFIAGIFFTSIFTTAPAIATLGEIASVQNIFVTAAFGALGAVIGDLIIFKFVRDKFAVHILSIMSHNNRAKRFRLLLKLKLFRWVSFLLGGLIIASPLPDELGISLLGFSKIKMRWFAPLSFVFNFIGIVLIGTVARAL